MSADVPQEFEDDREHSEDVKRAEEDFNASLTTHLNSNSAASFWNHVRTHSGTLTIQIEDLALKFIAEGEPGQQQAADPPGEQQAVAPHQQNISSQLSN